jgi:hypothetical protein
VAQKSAMTTVFDERTFENWAEEPTAVIFDILDSLSGCVGG